MQACGLAKRDAERAHEQGDVDVRDRLHVQQVVRKQERRELLRHAQRLQHTQHGVVEPLHQLQRFTRAL